MTFDVEIAVLRQHCTKKELMCYQDLSRLFVFYCCVAVF